MRRLVELGSFVLLVSIMACGSSAPSGPDPGAGTGKVEAPTATHAAPSRRLPRDSFERISLAAGAKTLSFPVLSAQPDHLEPAEVCSGKVITLVAKADAPFPAAQGDNAVHFTPCGVTGVVRSWSSTRIEVTVPAEAATGPVWIASANAGQRAALANGQRCLGGLQGLQGLGSLGFGAGVQCPGWGPLVRAPVIATALRGRPSRLSGIAGISTKPLVHGIPSDFGGVGGGCNIALPTGIGGTSFPLPSQPSGLKLIDQTPLGLGCFGTCNAIHAGSTNTISVRHPPRLVSFHVRDAVMLGKDRYEVENGDVDFDWKLTSDAPNPTASLSVGGVAVGNGLEAAGTRKAVRTAMTARLTAKNDCGTMTPVAVDLVPHATLTLSPPSVVLAPGQSATLHVTLGAKGGVTFPTPVHVVVWGGSTNGLDIQPTPLIVPANQTGGDVTITRKPGIASATAGTVIGDIFASPERPEDEVRLSDTVFPATVVGAAADAPPLVGLDHTRLKGHLMYRKCVVGDFAALAPVPADPDGCLNAAPGAPDVRPIRRARIEIWRVAGGGNVLVATTATKENGEFSIDIPYQDARFYVALIGSNPAGQVNWQDNDATWYWHDFASQQATAAGTLTFDWTATSRVEAGSFSALDALLVAWDFARNRLGVSDADVAKRLGTVSLIPRSTGTGGVALAAGPPTHIWLSVADALITDRSVMHEYGHHLQRMSNSYQEWAGIHKGCYATAVAGAACVPRIDAHAGCGMVDNDPDVSCWMNNEPYAWFEGFPQAFSFLAGESDQGVHVAFATQPDFAGLYMLYDATTCTCALATTPPTHNSSLHPYGPITHAAIEDYIVSLLYALARPAPGPNPARESVLMRVALDELKDRMPTAGEFKTRWLVHMPGDTGPFNAQGL